MKFPDQYFVSISSFLHACFSRPSLYLITVTEVKIKKYETHHYVIFSSTLLLLS